MVEITITTRHGERITTMVESLDAARTLLQQPHISIEGEGRFLVVNTAGIDVYSARTLDEPGAELREGVEQ